MVAPQLMSQVSDAQTPPMTLITKRDIQATRSHHSRHTERCSYVCQGLLFFILGIGKIVVLLSADTTGMGRSRWRARSYEVTRSAGWKGPGAAGRSIEGQHAGAAAE